MWPATPSSKPKREKRRKAAARRSLRWRRSSAEVAKTGGRGTRSMKALRAGEAADVDGCGMGTSVRQSVGEKNCASARRSWEGRSEERRRTSGGAQSGAAAAGLRDVCVRDGRAVRAGRHGDDERARVDAALPLVHSVFLVHSGFAGGGGINDSDSCGRRILPLGAHGVRRLLGIPGRVVELERLVSSGSRVRCFVYRLSDVLLPCDCGLEALRSFAGSGGADWLRERAGHPGSGQGGDGAGDADPGAGGGVVRYRGVSLAAQSVYAASAAAGSAISSLWNRAGAGTMAVLGLRASIERRRRSRQPAAELPAGAGGGGTAFDSHVFSADDAFACSARRLAEVAHRIFFRRGGVDWGAVAGILDDRGSHDRQCFSAERHGADEHAHALDDGR